MEELKNTPSFCITNKKIDADSLNLTFEKNTANYYIYTNKSCQFYHIKNFSIYIEGYIVPRNNIYEDYCHLSKNELIVALIEKYESDFIKHIKGFFLLLILRNGRLELYNDIHSVKRFFIGEENQVSIVSNDITILKRIFKPKFNSYAPALFAVFQHFVNGQTLLQNVYYSLPATKLTFDKNGLRQYQYLSNNYFEKLPKNKTTENQFHDIFLKSISNTLDYLKISSLSLTLTGGRDTRSILATLLYLNEEPRCFTFGYPTGIDVIVSQNLAKECSLSFSNHDIDQLNTLTYKQLVDEIINRQDVFVHLHRAHRLDAIKKEAAEFSFNLDAVFVGAMGGDYIMGGHFNDYIITEFIRRYLFGNEDLDALIIEILEKHFVVHDANTVSFIKEQLKLLNLEPNRFDKSAEFSLVHRIIGCTHDIQDINVFFTYSKHVVAPYMDLDVMEALFSSPLSLFHNSRHTKNPIKRLRGGELQSSVIKKYSPLLASIPFANRYTANDVLGNRLLYLLKRTLLELTKPANKPTFSYGDWFADLIKHHLFNNEQFGLTNVYNMSAIKETLFNNSHETHEGYWHVYSNPVMLNLYYNNIKE